MSNTELLAQFSTLPDHLKNEVADFIAFLQQKNKPNIPKERKFGGLKGMFIMSSDFDEQLDDFKEYM